jgi:3-keto-5-aminohexanoate cleavage enzyme
MNASDHGALSMEKVIITIAVTGSRPTKQMNPAVPYSPKEIARSAIESWRAGAAIAHIHVRDPETGAPASDLNLFREVVDRIRGETDLILNLTTSGLFLQGDNSFKKRLRVLELQPEICSLDVGSMNFQDRAFINPPEWGELAAKTMLEQKVKPEIEVFEIGHIRQAIDLVERGLIQEPAYFQLCLGVKWGADASRASLMFLKGKLPSNAKWSVLGVGQHQLAMITAGIEEAGHVRLGFEDNLYLRKSVLAESNSQFVKQAVDLAHQLDRDVATAEEARTILGL